MGIPPPPSYENAVSQKRNGVDLAALHQNADALHNFRPLYGTGPVGAGDGTMSTNSTWDFNTIDNPFYRAMNEQSDYSFVRISPSFYRMIIFQLRELTIDDLLARKANLEKEMDAELRALQARYHSKRQAILDAIESKKNGTIQF